MKRAVDVWAGLTDSEKADIALETAHLPRAYELLQALDREVAVPPLLVDHSPNPGGEPA